MKKNKFKIILLFPLFVLCNCSDDGWSEDRKTLFIKEWNCLEKVEKKITLEEAKASCSCVEDQFIERFSWDEYQKMKNETITDESNPEIENKLDNYMKALIDECNISF